MTSVCYCSFFVFLNSSSFHIQIMFNEKKDLKPKTSLLFYVFGYFYNRGRLLFRHDKRIEYSELRSFESSSLRIVRKV